MITKQALTQLFKIQSPSRLFYINEIILLLKYYKPDISLSDRNVTDIIGYARLASFHELEKVLKFISEDSFFLNKNTADEFCLRPKHMYLLTAGPGYEKLHKTLLAGCNKDIEDLIREFIDKAKYFTHDDLDSIPEDLEINFYVPGLVNDEDKNELTTITHGSVSFVGISKSGKKQENIICEVRNKKTGEVLTDNHFLCQNAYTKEFTDVIEKIDGANNFRKELDPERKIKKTHAKAVQDAMTSLQEPLTFPSQDNPLRTRADFLSQHRSPFLKWLTEVISSFFGKKQTTVLLSEGKHFTFHRPYGCGTRSQKTILDPLVNVLESNISIRM